MPPLGQDPETFGPASQTRTQLNIRAVGPDMRALAGPRSASPAESRIKNSSPSASGYLRRALKSLRVFLNTSTLVEIGTMYINPTVRTGRKLGPSHHRLCRSKIFRTTGGLLADLRFRENQRRSSAYPPMRIFLYGPHRPYIP